MSTPQNTAIAPANGMLAMMIGRILPLQVLKSAAGYYIGTADDEGPCSRESCEYFPTRDRAAQALASGAWTQASI